MFPVVILAGGLATRLRPLTEKIPKALIDINGEPFIAHQLRLLKSQNVTDVVLCIGYLGEMIQEYIGDGSDFGLNVQYSKDGKTLLGTAGAIKQALSLLPENFFVMYGDSYLPCNFQFVQQHFLHADKKGLMTVFHNHGLWDSSNVEFSHGKIIKYDKIYRTKAMEYIDYGLGIFSKPAFTQVPANAVFDLASLYQVLLVQNELTAVEITQRFYEVGSHAGIKELTTHLVQEKK